MKRSRWFRFWADSLHDKKVLRLDDRTYRQWTQLLCIAAQADNGGRLPGRDDLALDLRLKPADVPLLIARLMAAGLLDKIEGGYAPHNWAERQYLSDSSTPRVRKLREKRRGNVTAAVSETAGETLRVTPHSTESEKKESEKKDSESAPPASTQPPHARALARGVLAGEQSPELMLRTRIAEAYAERGLLPPDTGRAAVWLARGFQPELCVAVVRSVLEQRGNVKTLAYFDGAIADAMSPAQPARSKSDGTPKRTLQDTARDIERRFHEEAARRRGE